MNVYGTEIPDKALTNLDLLKYVSILDIPNFRGVFMRDTLPKSPFYKESGIVNFNTSKEPGSHWVCYYKNGENIIYFDSYGQTPLQEVQNYLKNIHRNTDVVQKPGTSICGHLCLYVLKSLSNGQTFRDVLDSLTTGEGIKWSNNLADELHKPLRHDFEKRYVFVRNVDDVWAADLVDMQSLSKYNNSYKYILMIIDIFSKYGWAVPLKTKTGEEVSNALKTILSKNKPKKIWADKGLEFYNKKVQSLLKENDITLYSTENYEKSSVVERWNRTIKTWLWKYFTANNTYKYIDVLKALIEKYNTKKHRSTGFTPYDARKARNQHIVFKNLYYDKVKKKLAQNKPSFKVGDKVRLGIQKDHFEKAYIINWTDKIYTIKDVKNTFPYTYTVQDDRGVEHKGSFYKQDLQKTDEDTYRVQKILRYKTQHGKKYALVKWLGYDKSFNSWGPVSSLWK